MLDTSKGKTPQETIQKSEQIKRAALAPSNPSSADLKIAANAEAMKNNAQSELRKELMDTKAKFSSKNPLKIYNDTEIPNILGLF